MSKLAKVLQAAAGNAGDVIGPAAAIDFDGASDYLRRTSDFTGNADGKTFTFSAWFYATAGNQTIYSSYQSRFNIRTEGTYLRIRATNSFEDVLLAAYPNVPLNTWCHILISVNLANTSQRHIYINDVSYTNFSTYVDGSIDFTETQHYIGASNSDQIYKIKGRLSNVFLDHTYRDLSVTNNRRLFITEDGKPADGQAGLSPIMYMPLDDPEDIGNNAGTGGDFTVNGVMARSGRGPNQDNTVASYFASNDYLSNSIGLSGSAWTISFIYKNHETANTAITGIVASSTYTNGQLTVLNNESDKIVFGFYEPTGGKYWQVDLLKANGMDLTVQKTYHITMSCDFSDVTKTKCYVNGVLFSHYTNGAWNSGTLSFSTSLQINNDTSNSRATRANVIGELYINPVYTDLATSNPFWDSDLNKPVSLRKVIEDTGITPAIALPMLASNPGLNLGTDGNFTVTSGPYTGARGPSETITRTAKFNGTSNYLTRGNTLSNSSAVTMAFVFRPGTTTEQQEIFTINAAGGSDYIRVVYWYNSGIGVGPRISFFGYNSSAVTSMEVTTSNSSQYNPGNWMVVLFSVNGSTGSTRLYVNGVSASLGTNYNNGQVLAMNQNNTNIGAKRNSGNLAYSSFLQGELGALYVNSGTYIDFSQEANRLKFVDALGYPTDWSTLIEDGTIATPEVFVPLSNPSNFGENLGTGGDFTVANTPTVGSDASF